MAINALTLEKMDSLRIGVRSYEDAAEEIFEEARRAAIFIPRVEFLDIYESAPEMEYHHKFVQSLITWIWYEVHENEVPLENLPDPLAHFFMKYEKPFAAYWS